MRIAIKKIREINNLSQNEFASMLGVTQGAVHQWEIGATKPRTDMLIKICTIFGVKPDEIIVGGDAK